MAPLVMSHYELFYEPHITIVVATITPVIVVINQLSYLRGLALQSHFALMIYVIHGLTSDICSD